MADKKDRRKDSKQVQDDRRKNGERRKTNPDMSSGTTPLNRESDWDDISQELKKKR